MVYEYPHGNQHRQHCQRIRHIVLHCQLPGSKSSREPAPLEYFYLSRSISRRCKVVRQFLWSKAIEQAPDGLPKSIDSTMRSFPEYGSNGMASKPFLRLLLNFSAPAG